MEVSLKILESSHSDNDRDDYEYYSHHDYLVSSRIRIGTEGWTDSEKSQARVGGKLINSFAKSDNGCLDIEADCWVQADASSIQPASILACVMCLTRKKHLLTSGGFISAGAFGPPLVRFLKRLGIQFKVSIPSK